MHPFRFSKPLAAEESERLRTFWTSLSHRGSRLDTPAIHQRWVDEHARFVIALARQHQRPTLEPEALLEAAHRALVAFLNQTGNQPEVIDRHLHLVLREAMIQVT